MQIHNAAITGSFTYNGIDISDITGSETSVVALNSFSASILNYTSSNNEKIAALNAATASLYAASASLYNFSASILSYTSSTDNKIAQLNRETASLNLATASINNATASLYNATASINNFSASILSYTASNNASITSLYAATASINNYTASNNANIAALNAATASLYNATASIYLTTASLNAATASLNQYTQSLNLNSSSFATTGSNTFVGTQYISAANNPVSFTSTASLYSDGGVRITKDMYVSGTAYFNNVTVFGTQSINYITSSQLNIASNLITVNTSTPAVRFGGLAVYDSGSLGTGLTGSILWDSEANHWVYSNPSGSSYSGGMFISGPRSAALGSEQGTTNNALMKGQGGDHITSSGVFEVSGSVGIGTSSPAQQLHLTGYMLLENNQIIRWKNTSGAERNIFVLDTNNDLQVGGSISNIRFLTNDSSERVRINVSGSVGIGTTAPVTKLQIDKSSQSYSSSTPSGATIISNLAGGNGILEIGVDTTYLSYIQSRNITNTTYYNLLLQPLGGSVGIGTTNPSASLHVHNGNGLIYRGDGGRPSFNIYNNTANTTWQHVIQNTGRYDIRYRSGYNDDPDLTTGSISITNAGSVGIGTTSPVGRLMVQASGTAPSITVFGEGSNASGILGGAFHNMMVIGQYIDGSSYGHGFISYGYNGDDGRDFSIGTATTSTTSTSTYTPRVTFKPSGNVGIGTTSPTVNLDIENSSGWAGLDLNGNSGGEIRLQQGGVTYGQIYANSPASSGLVINAAGAGNDIYFQSAGSTKMVMLDSGNVGIGTTSPGYLLDVKGLGTIARMTDGTSHMLFYAGSGLNEISTVSPLLLTVSGSERVRIKTDGNVGIGTPVPSQKLHISGSGTTYVRIEGVGNNTTGLLTKNGGREYFTGTYYNVTDAWEVADITAGGSTRLVINTSGSVGIGTTSPVRQVEIYGASLSADTPTLRISSADSSGTRKFGIEFYSRTGADVRGKLLVDNNGRVYLDDNGGGGVVLQANGGTGNVGIGTTSPDSKFHMAPSNGSQIRFNYAGSGDNYYDGVTHYFRNGNGASNVMTLLNGGNVGIGTTSPLAKLDVRGSGNNQTLAVYQGASGSSAGIYIENTGSISIASARIYLDNLDNFVIGRGGGTDRIGMAISASGAIGINTLPTSTARLVISGSTNVANIQGSGSNIFTVDGTSGRLFSVDDDLTNSLFSVNTIAGLPVIEAFADNTVRLGRYSATSGSVMNITGSIIDLPYGQIRFPASQSASSNPNTLDDYEEGEFTPVLRGSTTSGSYTYDTDRTNAQYVKIGRKVYVQGAYRVASVVSAGSGNALIGGLPFQPAGIDTSWTRIPGSMHVQSGPTLPSASIFTYTQGETYADAIGIGFDGITGWNQLDVTVADEVNAIWWFAITYLV